MPGPVTLIGLGLLLTGAGAGFGSASLFVPGVGLSLLVVGLTLWVRLAASVLQIQRAPGPATLIEGENYPLHIEISTGFLPQPGAEISDPLLPSPATLAPGRKELEMEVPVHGRGRCPLKQCEVRLTDPLGIHSASKSVPINGEVLVLPRTEPVEVDRGRGGAGIAEMAGAAIASPATRIEASAVEFEIDGLRPYREGSPASRIHWPTVARTGEMIERRLIAGSCSAPFIVLDASRPVSESALDSAVRAAASLCVFFAAAGGCSLLLPGENRPLDVDSALSRWPNIHARLALVESGTSLRGAARFPRTGPVLWVSANRASEASAELRKLKAARHVLVSPGPLAQIPVAFSVAGCHGQALAALRGRVSLSAGAAA